MEKAYLDLLEDVMKNGKERTDRTGVGTRSVFGRQIRFNLKDGFPLLTTKKVPMRLISSELIWFLTGNTSIKRLIQENNKIWDEWGFEQWAFSDEYEGPDMKDFGIRITEDEEFNKVYQEQLSIYKKNVLEDKDFELKYGNLGPVYGKQWRSFEGHDGKTADQIINTIKNLKENPDSRRHVISAWQPAEIEDMALPPCHILFQFYVQDEELSCQLYMRSTDIFLGLPFNIASYALLTHMIAKEVGLGVGDLVITMGDAHIYKNHYDQVNLQLSREPLPAPTLKELPNESIFDIEVSDIQLENYVSYGTIKAPVAV